MDTTTMISQLQAALAGAGSIVVLRRPANGSGIDIDVSVLAAIRGYQPHELIGGIIQGDRQVVMGNTEIEAAGWPLPPKKNDVVIVRGKTMKVIEVDIVEVDSTIVRYNLQVRG
jgi:hypothetical protein